MDKDQVCEKVLVFETSEPSEYGNIREIQVLKYSNGKWVVWRKSRQAILRSQEGGIMEDPFEEITIEKGILIISFSGEVVGNGLLKTNTGFKTMNFS